ncbi:MAG: hypothetical protein IT177_03960 [Acidobacteria bacterium]|nr:hypothetical protein [Acidobacteriota bacterium]
MPRFVRTLAACWLISGVTAPAVAGQELPAPPQDFSVVRVEGQAVTLEWAHAVPEAPPDAYVVEGGFAPGETWATATLGGTATSATFVLANGVYFARLRAVHDGVPTAASEEIEVVVGTLRRPSAPEAVAALAIGSDVTVTWRNTYQGGAPQDVLLEVTGALRDAIAVPASGEVRFSGVPSGAYGVTLRARNTAGASEASPPVTVVVDGGTVEVVQTPGQSPDAPRLPVRFEDYSAARLAEFAARERLVEVVQGASSDFEAILLLKDWVAAQWPDSVPDPYPPWDAITILDWIREGRTGGFCAQYAQVFLQALAAIGIPARYVEVGQTDNPYAHFTTEVWSNHFNKWVLVDAHYNLHFERDGIPQSVLEVHDAFVRGQHEALDVVLGAVREGHPDPRDYPHRTAGLYYYVRYLLKADHVSAPNEPPADRYEDTVEWVDEHTVPWESSTVPSEYPHERLTRYETDDRALVEWSPNQVWITPERTGPLTFTLSLQHTVLQPARAEYRVIDDEGTAGPWQPQASGQITWTIGPRDRRLEVRGVNVRGIAGPVSAVAIVP